MIAKLKILFAALAMCLGTATLSQASSVTLDTLLAPGASFISGDKVFDNFMYAFTGDMPAASDINVIAITDINGNHGIRFQGGFMDHVGGGASDALITFDVAVEDPSKFLITGAEMLGNPMIAGLPGVTGMAIVTETFAPAPESMQIFHLPPGVFDGADSVTFGSTYTKLNVRKDILLESMVNNVGTGVANLSQIDQTFVQRMVPEPTSLGLAGLGVLGLFLHRRRRS